MTIQDKDTGTADLGYRSSVGKVEPYGVDHIPDVEKHGKPVSQFYVWFAAGLSFPIMILGFSAASLGLSLTAAVTAVIIGAVVGSILMGVLSRMGVHLGIPQQMQARGPLGYVGNIPPVAYINVFAGIGWSAVNVILAGRALNLLIGLPFWISALVLTALMMVIAVYGYNMIHFLQKWLTYVLVPLFVLVTIVALANGSSTLHTNPKASGFVGSAGSWMILSGWFLAFLVAWAPFASDYSRYLPDNRKTSIRAGIFTGLGNLVTMVWLGIVGVILAGTTTSSDPIIALKHLMGPWFSAALLAVLLSVFSQNSLNIYGGAISIQTLGLPFKRKQAVVIMCALAYVVSLYGSSGVYSKFLIFLNLTSYFIAPYVAVILMDYLLGGRRDKTRLPELYDKRRILGWGFVAWLAGVLASVPFWESATYTGPFAASHASWGDLSMYAGFVIAIVVYLATYRMKPLWSLNASAKQSAGNKVPAGAESRANDAVGHIEA
jgi:NCS1 family nucleobase:cation symporter-1